MGVRDDGHAVRGGSARRMSERCDVACDRRAMGNCGERCGLVELRHAKQGEAHGGNRHDGERHRRGWRRRLPKDGCDRCDVGESEHGKADAGPPIPNSAKPQGNEPVRLFRSD